MVNLAVDMVTLHNIYDLAIIVSGDQDYVPAAQAVKDMGKPVVNVGFLARNGYASGEGHRGGGRAHANGLAQNARSGQLVYDQGIRQLQRLAAAGANSKAGDR
jgi:hypothetical protein